MTPADPIIRAPGRRLILAQSAAPLTFILSLRPVGLPEEVVLVEFSRCGPMPRRNARERGL